MYPIRAVRVPGFVIGMVLECVVALESRSDSKSNASRVCVVADSCRGESCTLWASISCGFSMRISCFWRAEGVRVARTSWVLANLGDIFIENVG